MRAILGVLDKGWGFPPIRMCARNVARTQMDLGLEPNEAALTMLSRPPQDAQSI